MLYHLDTILNIFQDPGMSKGYCRSLHTFEWFPDINAELRFPVERMYCVCALGECVCAC